MFTQAESEQDYVLLDEVGREIVRKNYPTIQSAGSALGRIARRYQRQGVSVRIVGPGYRRDYPAALADLKAGYAVATVECPRCGGRMDRRAQTCRTCYDPLEHPLHIEALGRLNERRRRDGKY